MWTLPEFESCAEVGPELMDSAFAPGGEPPPARRVARLLDRMARVARPDEGAHRILLVLARLAASDWLGGRLELTLSAFGLLTEVDVRVGDGKQRRRWRTYSVAVPLSELSDWAREHPGRLAPLAPYGEPLPERLCLRSPLRGASEAPKSEDAAPPSKTGRGDIHRRMTVRMEVVPPSAAKPSEPPDRDTVKPPQAQPTAATPNESDDTDSGWD